MFRLLAVLTSLICLLTPIRAAAVVIGKSDQPCVGARIILDPHHRQSIFLTKNGDVENWDIAQGRMINSWRAGSGAEVIDALALGSSRNILMSEPFGIVMLDAASGRILSRFDYQFGVRNLTYYTLGASSDSRLAAAVGLTGWPHYLPAASGIGLSSGEHEDARKQQEQKLVLLDVESGSVASAVEFTDSFVHDVRFTADSQFLITTSYLNVKFWKIGDRSKIELVTTLPIARFNVSQQPENIIVAAATSSDLRLLAVSTYDGLYVIDTKSQTIAHSLQWPFNHGIWLIRYLQFAPDNRRILGTSLQGHIAVWSINDGGLETQASYRLGGSGIDDVIESQSSDGSPHPNFLVDADFAYYVRPGPIDIDSLGSCAGFEVGNLDVARP